jgi:uncharacterized protein YyaL (SSP411 family)
LKLAFAGLAPEPRPARSTWTIHRCARRAPPSSDHSTPLRRLHPSPEIPHPGSIERCLRQWHGTAADTSPDLKALYMATLTLTRMAEGGIYDQLAGGFSRYSVDGQWMIPHFEKMLYDNGQLLCELLRARPWPRARRLFAAAAAETADWVLRDMRSPQGGFYSSLDADSEGHEGKVLRVDAVRSPSPADPAEYAAFSRRFGLNRGANFEGEWHLHTYESVDTIAAALGESAQTVAGLIESARAKLLKVRELRVWPARDEKILTAWNALMIKGLAIASRVLRRPDLADAATAAVDFIRHRLWRDGRLLATYKDGRAHLPAYLDDYAYLADALLELLQTRWRSSDLEFARQLIEVMRSQFEDPAAADFSSPPRITNNSFTAARPTATIPSPRATASPHPCCAASDTCWANCPYLDAAERTLKRDGPCSSDTRRRT